jgi:hypothetical protein
VFRTTVPFMIRVVEVDRSFPVSSRDAGPIRYSHQTVRWYQQVVTMAVIIIRQRAETTRALGSRNWPCVGRQNLSTAEARALGSQLSGAALVVLSRASAMRIVTAVTRPTMVASAG